MFPGQAAVVPDAAFWHGPADGLHTVLEVKYVLGGQVAEPPVQYAAFWHGPVEGPHTVVEGR